MKKREIENIVIAYKTLNYDPIDRGIIIETMFNFDVFDEENHYVCRSSKKIFYSKNGKRVDMDVEFPELKQLKTTVDHYTEKELQKLLSIAENDGFIDELILLREYPGVFYPVNLEFGFKSFEKISFDLRFPAKSQGNGHTLIQTRNGAYVKNFFRDEKKLIDAVVRLSKKYRLQIITGAVTN